LAAQSLSNHDAVGVDVKIPLQTSLSAFAFTINRDPTVQC
jgi:hypothetical protein